VQGTEATILRSNE